VKACRRQQGPESNAGLAIEKPDPRGGLGRQRLAEATNCGGRVPLCGRPQDTSVRSRASWGVVSWVEQATRRRAAVGEEQRRQHRIGVALEVIITGANRHGIAFEETTHSNDVSRGGCSFYTAHEISVGAELDIEIIRHLTGSQSSFLTRGLVLRAVEEAPDRMLIAVRFIGPQFPTYSSETTS